MVIGMEKGCTLIVIIAILSTKEITVVFASKETLGHPSGEKEYSKDRSSKIATVMEKNRVG